jgi:hypothetical protein
VQNEHAFGHQKRAGCGGVAIVHGAQSLGRDARRSPQKTLRLL